MLIKLEKKHIDELLMNLQSLSDEDRYFFHPHIFDKKILENLLTDKENYYIYREDNKNIGYCFLRTFGRYETPTLGCIIWKKYRHKNHGYKMMVELIQKNKELGNKKLKLKVYKENINAIKLYEKCGFEKIDEGGDEIWMEIKHL